MAETVHCNTHGETNQAFVCVHLTAEGSGLGFNREEPDSESPTPDAWCDNCEIIRKAHDGWTDEAQALTKIVLLCAHCYERVRIRNTCPTVTLDDLASLRWQCGSCDEWHEGPCLDQGFDSPYYWSEDNENGTRWNFLPSGAVEKPGKSFLDEDYCAVDDEHFFVRGIIELPILGTDEKFCWGVWGSLSRTNFEALLKADQSEERVDFPPMFSWLSTKIPDYPDTLGLRMHAHIQGDNLRPIFELEASDHPLSQEFHHGIAPERVKEITLRGLPSEE